MVFRNSTVIIKEHFIQRDVLKAGRSPVIKFLPHRKKKRHPLYKNMSVALQNMKLFHMKSQRDLKLKFLYSRPSVSIAVDSASF